MRDEIKLRDDVVVKLIDSMGDDASVVRAARVSTDRHYLDSNIVARPVGCFEIPDKDKGLIKYLMRDKHGTPFEHNAMTFYVEAPIFVFREWHRHRVGFSYNEMSGRYTELAPEFYAPHRARRLVQVGKPGHYTFEHGSQEQWEHVMRCDAKAYEAAWISYQSMLGIGVAKEVARTVLPVGIYSKMFVTCNARSLMHFLSLRTFTDYAKFPSHPQREIEMCAEMMETEFERLFPVTWLAFCDNGRVSP